MTGDHHADDVAKQQQTHDKKDSPAFTKFLPEISKDVRKIYSVGWYEDICAHRPKEVTLELDISICILYKLKSKTNIVLI